MKKKLLNILIVFISLITSCGTDKEKDNPGIVSIGETVVLKSENEEIAEITYNSCDDEEVEDKDKIMIIENVTIKPKRKIKVNNENFYLHTGFHEVSNEENLFYLDRKYNILKNDFYILDEIIENEITYNLCFIIPKEKNNLYYYGINISLIVFSSFSFSYSFYSKYYPNTDIFISDKQF